MPDEAAIEEAPPPVYAAPPGTRMPLPSIEEQTRRWETPYDRQLANDLASEQAGLAQAQQEAAQAAATNAQLARSREAVKMATEFVRRKEAERMVREGMSLEEAEFKSRIKYNTATASQLNAMRPVRQPTPLSIGGVMGVTTGRGDQWKPLPRPPAPKPTQEELDQKKWNLVMKQKDSKFYDQILDAQKKAQMAAANEDETEAKKWIAAEQTLVKQRANLQKQLQAGQALKVGTIYKDHRFKGGNPANKDSWEAVK